MTNRLKDCVDAILKLGRSELVVIHFPEGAVARLRNHAFVTQQALNVPPDEIQGATGAGDTFCAGILYGLYNEWALSRILEFAVCAGAQNLLDQYN